MEKIDFALDGQMLLQISPVTEKRHSTLNCVAKLIDVMFGITFQNKSGLVEYFAIKLGSKTH